MEELFRSLSESVSESCFDDIMGIVEELLLEEGIMNLIKQGMSPEEAKKQWAKDKNNEYIEAEGNHKNAARLRKKAYEKLQKGLVSPETFNKAIKDENKARKTRRTKFKTQLNANYDIKATKNKMVLPTYSESPDGTSYISGFTKGGKKFTPKKS